MRSAPSCTAEQIEYERRTSSPSMSVRSVRCWPCTKRNWSRERSGTANVIATASRVSRATRATVSGWNLLNAARSVRLEIVERLEARVAAVLRLARRRAELRDSACASSRSAGRHGDAARRSGLMPTTSIRGAAACRGGAMPKRGELARPPAPSSRSSTPATAGLDARRREPGRRERVGIDRGDHVGRRATRVRRRHDRRPRLGLDIDVADDAELDDRHHRDLRIGNAASTSHARVERRRARRPLRGVGATPSRRSPAVRRPHHGAARIGALQELHLGQQCPRCSVCTPCLPPRSPLPASTRRTASPASPRRSTAATASRHGPGSARTSAAMPASISASRRRRREHLAGVRPQVVERRLHPRVDTSVPSPRRITQSARALDVVRDFLHRLGRDLGDARIARRRQRVQQQQMPWSK